MPETGHERYSLGDPVVKLRGLWSLRYLVAIEDVVCSVGKGKDY